MAVKKAEREDREPTDTRFAKQGGGWEHGWFQRRLDDGTIEIISQLTGGFRTLFPKKVEFRSYGPRGGDLWTSAVEAERPMDKPAR